MRSNVSGETSRRLLPSAISRAFMSLAEAGWAWRVGLVRPVGFSLGASSAVLQTCSCDSRKGRGVAPSRDPCWLDGVHSALSSQASCWVRPQGVGDGIPPCHPPQTALAVASFALVGNQHLYPRLKKPSLVDPTDPTSSRSSATC